jgi:hypothetical protein
MRQNQKLRTNISSFAAYHSEINFRKCYSGDFKLMNGSFSSSDFYSFPRVCSYSLTPSFL